jgi:hypothetical protein
LTEPAAARRDDLAPIFVERFAEVGLIRDPARLADDVVIITRARELEIEVPLLGGSKFAEWDGSDSELDGLVREIAELFGREVVAERQEFGTTPWD